MDEHPTVLGDAELARLLDGSHDHGGRHVDVVVRVHELRIRRPDHPVVGRRRADLFCALRIPNPRVGIGGRDIAEACPQLGRAHLVIGERLPAMSAQRRLEHRVHLHRHDHTALELVRVVHLHLGPDEPRGLDLVGLLVPGEDGVGASCPHPRAPGLAAHQHRAVERPGEDLCRGQIHERLWGVATRRRVGRLRGLDAEPSRDEGRRIAVAPRQQLHHSQRLGMGDDVRRAGVGCRRPHCLDDEVDRAEGVVEAFGPVEVLADADDDRAARIRSHGRTIRVGTLVACLGPRNATTSSSPS